MAHSLIKIYAINLLSFTHWEGNAMMKIKHIPKYGELFIKGDENKIFQQEWIIDNESLNGTVEGFEWKNLLV